MPEKVLQAQFIALPGGVKTPQLIPFFRQAPHFLPGNPLWHKNYMYIH